MIQTTLINLYHREYSQELQGHLFGVKLGRRVESCNS